jgi:hypothetical protein
MSNALDRGELASRMERGHPASCASCRAFGRELAALDGRLSRDAHMAAPPPPVARRARSPWLVAGPLAAGVAAVIAIAVSTGERPQGPVAGGPPVQGPVVRIPVRGLADQVSRVLANTPLDTELDNLIHDGKRGLDAVLAAGGLR